MFVSISHLVSINPTSFQVAAQVVSGIGFGPEWSYGMDLETCLAGAMVGETALSHLH
jgi:hypothetical protein